MNNMEIKDFSNYKTYFLVLILICFIGCQHSNINNTFGVKKSNVFYDIEIDYSSMPLDDERRLAGGDTVVIGFVGQFSKDTVEIYKNNKFLETKVLSSDWQNEGAGHVLLDKYQQLDNVGIRINGGPLVFIEIDKRDFHINLAFYNNQVNVKFYKYLPATY
jgi:hypothetical protein